MSNNFNKVWVSNVKQMNKLIHEKNNYFFRENFGYFASLMVRGVGFRVWKNNSYLNMDIGYTHYISLKIPESVSVLSTKTKIVIFGKNIYLLDKFIFNLKKNKYPDSYKGKGIRSLDQEVKLKVGKVKN